MQTDPNFANYLYEPDSGRIQLLDFGATRSYPLQQRAALRSLLCACVEGDDTNVVQSAMQVGYLAEDDPTTYHNFLIKLLRTATEPARERDRICCDAAFVLCQASPHFSPVGEMIAQGFESTRHFLKERNTDCISD